MHLRPPRAAVSDAASRSKENKLFAWQLREASLALAPWTSDARHQAFVTATVFVAEQPVPHYALTFTVSAPQLSDANNGDGRDRKADAARRQSVQVVRKVTKQHMVSAFERAVSKRDEDEDFARLKTRRQGKEPTESSSGIDDAVCQWLLHGKAAPLRQEIAMWLLSRMLLVRNSTVDGESAWKLLICGEAGAELQRSIKVAMSPRASRTIEPKGSGSGCEEERGSVVTVFDYNDSEEDPPEYGAASHHTNEVSDSESEASNTKDEGEDNVDDEAGTASNGEFEFDVGTDADERVASGESPEEPMAMCTDRVIAKINKNTRGSSGSFAFTARTSESNEEMLCEFANLDNVLAKALAETPTAKSKFTFEPATVRARHRSSSASQIGKLASELGGDLANEWAQDRKSFQLELRKSKKDIRDARELQRKTEAIAHLRRQQLMTQSQRKLRGHDQRREDASDVRQLISNTLECHETLQTLETQVKRTKILAKREQERLSHSMRVAIGRSEKHIKGPILGPGPLSQLEIDAIGIKEYRLSDSGRQLQQDREDESDSFVYDLHGRRHASENSGDVSALGTFESAMRKIKRALDRNGTRKYSGNNSSNDLVHLFHKFDADRSGTLSRSEFERVLVACGAALTREQVLVLFQHFDPNGSGEIDYGELLWGFFNRRAFLKKWQLRKTKLSSHEIKLAFYQYDRVGRGALSLRDFQLAMDDIGFQLADDEVKLLALKFDANRDGFIDYREFYAFVSDCDLDAAANGKMRSGTAATKASRTRSG